MEYFDAIKRKFQSKEKDISKFHRQNMFIVYKLASEPLKVFLHVPHNEVPGNALVPLVADPAEVVGVVLALLVSRAQAGRTRGPLACEVSTKLFTKVFKIFGESLHFVESAL